jgi:ribonuclease VapC
VSSVLDASAVLALIQAEPGSARVQQAIEDGAYISAVNVTEVVTRQIDRGASESDARANVEDLEMQIVPFDEELAYRAARLRSTTRAVGLSLGDRACLALAERLGLSALTADRAWGALQISIQVDLIR